MPNLSLSLLLRLDAAACAAMAALLLAVGPSLAAATGLPLGLLLGAGLVLVPCAALMAWTAADPFERAPWVRLVVAGNAGWVAASVVVALPGVTSANALGVALTLGQAAAVAVLAAMEAAALRRGAVGP